MKNTKSLKICLFGNYDSHYSRNQIITKGLRLNDVDIIDCHIETPPIILEDKHDASFLNLLRRLTSKFSIVPMIISKLDLIPNCDVILVMYPGYFEVIFAYILKVVFRKPLLFDMFDSLYETTILNRKIINKNSLLAKILFYYEKLIIRLSNAVFVHSKADKARLSKRFGISRNKFRVLYIGADDSIYNYQGKKKNNTGLNVCYFGLYIPLHGVDVIVHAASFLKKYKDIKFYMVGRGQTYEDCRRVAKKLNANNIHFINSIGETSENMKYLYNSDIFLGVFEDSERIDQVLPNKVFQGMALGKALITANTSASLELLTHNKNSLLVSKGDPKALAKAILRIYENRELGGRIGRCGYRLFIDRFTPRQIGKSLIKDCFYILQNRNINTRLAEAFLIK